MESKDFTESDILSFTLKQTEIVHELEAKRDLVDDLRKQLRDATKEKEEIHMKFEAEAANVKKLKERLQLANKMMAFYIKTHNDNEDKQIRQEVEVEILAKQIQATGELYRKTQQENDARGEKLEQLQRTVNQQEQFKQSFIEQMTKMEQAKAELMEMLQTIDVQFLKLSEEVSVTCDLNNTLKQNVERHENEVKRLQKVIEDLTNDHARFKVEYANEMAMKYKSNVANDRDLIHEQQARHIEILKKAQADSERSLLVMNEAIQQLRHVDETLIQVQAEQLARCEREQSETKEVDDETNKRLESTPEPKIAE